MDKKDLVRFSISIDWELLKEFDEVIRKKGYENRSFAARALFREFILSSKLQKPEEKKGLFVILTLSDEGACQYCNEHFSTGIPLKNGKKLCICLIEGLKSEAEEKLKELASNSEIEFCKLIAVEICKDD